MKLDFKQLAQNGFVEFSCGSASESTLDIAQAIGRVASISGISSVQELTPCPAESREKSSYSGIFGMDAFPLHTDMAHWHIPPRFLLLRCIQPTNQVYTTLVPAHELFDAEDRIPLKRALFRPRRRLDGRLTILRLYNEDIYRWDTVFIQPINRHAIALQARIVNRIDSVTVRSITFEDSNECILIDNWKVLHGRSAVPDSAAHRIVERVYLSNVRE